MISRFGSGFLNRNLFENKIVHFRHKLNERTGSIIVIKD